MNDQLEPDGGNLYKAHMFQVTSGQFWRCAHGITGFGKGMIWVGCEECKVANPEAYRIWQGKEETQ